MRAQARKSGGCSCGGHCAKCASASAVSSTLRAPGRPLDDRTRARMERRFDHDFSRVRIHTGSDAEQSAAGVGASAYTVGRDVVFGLGGFEPDTPRGAKLLTHELAHVVQQRHADEAAGFEVGAAGDAFERDADRATAQRVPPVQVASGPRLQRGPLDVLRDVALFIPRLFGAGGYPDEELKEYVDGIKKNNAIEGGIFSDNKARGAVSSEAAIGPFDRETKVLLIEEMLKGWTSILDEGAIIDLLRRQSKDERTAIVNIIGRDRLWSNFSFGNRRMIESLTLSAADATDALASRLRGMTEGQLDDYAQNTDEPAIRELVDKVRLLHKITAPAPTAGVVATSPADATGLPGGSLPAKGIKSVIKGVEVYALPDIIDSSLSNTQYTDFYVHYSRPSVEVTTANTDGTPDSVITFHPAKIVVLLRTRWASWDKRSGPSKYGVGSESSSGTLQEHERSHGKDYYDFLEATPPPAFGGKNGMTIAEFDAEVKKFDEAMAGWSKEANVYSIRATDCSTMKKPTDADLAGTGYKASICYPAAPGK